MYLWELLGKRNTAVDVECRCFGGLGTLSQKDAKVNLPDYNTSVNVHRHNLKRQDETLNKRWEELKDLQKRIAGK